MRFLDYILQRFPLVQTLPFAGFFGLGIYFTVSAVTGSAANLVQATVVCLALFLFLLQLRFFDDVKDAHHDRAFHSDRPIPKGEVNKKHLLLMALAVISMQLLLAINHSLLALSVLVVSILYALILFLEGVSIDVLRENFSLYILIHEVLLIPLLLYLFVLSGMTLDLLMSKEVILLLAGYSGLFFMIEVGRKIKSADNESGGNDSYTEQYGVRGAVTLLCITGISSIVFLLSAAKVSPVLPDTPLIMCTLLLLFFVLTIFGVRFVYESSAINASQLFGCVICFTASCLSLYPLLLMI